MLNSLKKASQEVGREIHRAWDSLSDGWRELLSRSGDSLTHFTKHNVTESSTQIHRFPSWSVLAGEVEETNNAINVRLEVPGLERDDLDLMVEGNTLRISGEKRYTRDEERRNYHIMERAYGSFQRVIPLPHPIDGDNAEATLNHGVLSVRLPKTGATSGKQIKVS